MECLTRTVVVSWLTMFQGESTRVHLQFHALLPMFPGEDLPRMAKVTLYMGSTKTKVAPASTTPSTAGVRERASV